MCPTREIVTTTMIDKLLKHMVTMTGHRDQALLDASIIAALQELVGATRLRALEIYKHDHELYLRQRVWLANGVLESIDEQQLWEQEGEPVSRYPALATCIAERKLQAEQKTDDGQYMLWLPVWLNDRITACMELTNTKPYAPHAMHMIEGILSVYRNYQTLLDYSERDSLTGLLNRKTFDERFVRMVSNIAEQDDSEDANQPERRQAHAPAHWLAVVDIDHFKRVNDQFGHLYGDEVLILVANRLRSSFRAQDKVFRFGGEEFVILLRSTTLEDAQRTFERFRKNIEEHEFPQVGTVTVSIGFASISEQTPVVILGHADQALYYAKANGRNRVCHYDYLVKHGMLLSETSNEAVEFFFDASN
jgi:diguanylate cyclase (GGDEF)-like protein